MAVNPYASDVDQSWYVSASPPTGVAAILKLLYGLSLLFSIAGVACFYSDYRTLSAARTGELTEEQLQAHFVQVATVGAIRGMVALVTAVTFLIWIYRSNRFLHEIGVQNLAFTPFWSVAWFFIPIACLWKPFQVVRDILQKSHSSRLKHPRTKPFLYCWWGLLIMGIFWGWAAARVARKAERIDELQTSYLLGLLGDVSLIGYFIFAILLVSKISRLQQQFGQAEGFSDRGGRIPLFGAGDAMEQSPT